MSLILLLLQVKFLTVFSNCNNTAYYVHYYHCNNSIAWFSYSSCTEPMEQTVSTVGGASILFLIALPRPIRFLSVVYLLHLIYVYSLFRI
jgi:hypothetical protein